MDKTVRVHSINQGQMKMGESLLVGKHKGIVRAVKYSFDDLHLISGGQDGLKLWDL